ncbi:MAG: oligosaccharide flippase family protein, partial [Terriglobales bacterium]
MIPSGAGGLWWRLDALVWLGALASLVGIWLGYPLVLRLWARGRARRWRRLDLSAPDADWPRLSVIVAAHNEAAHIEARIADLRAQDYPADRVEILVSEDGSTDGTAALLERLAAEPAAPPLRLCTAPGRAGKAAALNRAAAAAGGEVLVFTDANNTFAPLALRHLAAPFADPAVGAVTGLKAVAGDAGVGGGESVYWRYEAALTRHESDTGGTVAAYGEALAVRRECFRPLPEDVLVNDDLCLALRVWSQRRRVVAAPAARSLEWGAADMRSEWERRRRMAAGHWQALAAARPPAAGWPLAVRIKIWFHQILRPLSALFAALALVCGLALLWPAAAASIPAGLRLLAGLEGLAAAAVAVVGLTRAAGLRLGRAEAPWFFCVALAAAACGWWQYRRGHASRLWRRVARAAPAPAGAPGPAATARILNGLFWAASSFVGGKLLVFGSVVVLARLLAPRAFGEVALATTTITVLEILGTLGLTSALIFEEQEWRAAANICFWITLATSGLELAGAWLLAPLLSHFFHEPTLTAMIRWLSLVLVLLALGNTHDFVLRRRLDFRTKIIPDLGQAAAKGTAAIALACLGFGAWSLIWGQVLGTIASTALLWRLSGWRPEWRWDGVVLRRMFDYAKHIYLLDGSSVLLSNLDTLTIGRMLSDAWLGFYTLAFRIPEVALVSVLNVITRVVFPAFSRLQSDRPHLRATLLDTMRYTALLTLPVAAGLAVLARGVVLGLYGAHWGPSVAVLRVLAVYCGIRCLIHHFGDAYKAIGRPDVLTRTTVCWWIILPPSLILGARWGGIVGVAWGQVVTRVVMSLLHVYLIGKYLQIGPWALLEAVGPALEATAVMATLLTLALPWADGWAPRLELAALVPLG